MDTNGAIDPVRRRGGSIIFAKGIEEKGFRGG